jgi:hypothetical protein
VAPCKQSTHICDILRVPLWNVSIALHTGGLVLKPQVNTPWRNSLLFRNVGCKNSLM